MQDVTLAILAGGASSRMGVAKTELTVADSPILQYLLARFAWIGPTLLVTAPGRQHPPGFQLFDREVSDPIADQGPLRGILTALDAASTDLLLVATVDMPAVSPDQLRWLVDRFRARESAAGLLMRHGQRIEPFPSIYRKDAAELIRDRMEKGERSVHRLLSETHFALIDVPSDWPAAIWTNLNCPADVEAFRNL